MTLATQKNFAEAGQRHLFSLEAYNRMIDAGILTTQDKVELIRGEIVDMAPMGNRHLFLVSYYHNELLRLYGDKLYQNEVVVISQCPVQISPNSEPEPDIMLLKSPIERYKERKPQGEDVLLIIEISDSTLAYDRGRKLGLYAEANISEVWIRNLQDDVLEVYREPIGDRYGLHLTLSPGEKITPLFSDVVFDWSTP